MLVCDKRNKNLQLCEWLLCGIPTVTWGDNASESNTMQVPRVYVAILVSSRQNKSLDIQIIWNKSTHELCTLMATETICMGLLLLCWTITRLHWVWQKRRSFLETSFTFPSSLRLWMENNYTTGWQLIRIPSLHFKHEGWMCASISSTNTIPLGIRGVQIKFSLL